MNTMRCLFVVSLCLTSRLVDAASVEWFFTPDFDFPDGRAFRVSAVIYGDDNRGLGAYQIAVTGLDELGIDPSTVSWTEAVGFRSRPTVTSAGDGFFVSNSQLEEIAPSYDIAQPSPGFRLSTEIGLLVIPGTASFFTSNFRDSSATLFSLDAPNLPPADITSRTLPPRNVSTAMHGGDVIADYILRVVPDRRDIDFGEVSLGTNTLEDIIALINHGFGGPTLDVTGMEITGQDAALFDVPGFSPSTLHSGEAATTYDVSFSPTRPGTFQAEVAFNVELPIFGSDFARFSLVGVAVPEPASWLLVLLTLAAATHMACRAAPR